MKLAIYILFLSKTLSGMPNEPPSVDKMAIETVERFLSWVEKNKPSGIYRDRFGKELPVLLSPELLCLLENASAIRETSAREFPSEKPPFVEGNPFIPMPGNL